MNLMLYLNSVETKLKTLRRSQKIQLYLLPFIVAILVVLNFVEIKSQILFEPKKELEKNSVDSYSFIKQLETFAFENKLTLFNIKQNGRVFNLEIEGEFSNIIKAIHFCETYESVNEIENIKLRFIEETAHLKIYFELAEHKYEPNEKEISFSLKKSKIPIVEQAVEQMKQSLEINAIINKEALINNQWVCENDLILGHKVLKINQHTVVVINEKKEELELKLIKE
ncbi:MAG: hypothetical protein WC141_04280 [Arcobacteraceae bacterium]